MKRFYVKTLETWTTVVEYEGIEADTLQEAIELIESGEVGCDTHEHDGADDKVLCVLHSKKYNFITCNQCTSIIANNIFCHEQGCPNKDKVWSEEEEEWLDKEVDDDEEEDCARV